MVFTGKVVLITGASSGIGAGAALHLSKLGASVALVGRNETRLNKVADQIKNNGSPAPLAIVADVTKDAERIINETVTHFEKLDVLVNNAGIFNKNYLATLTLEKFDEIFSTNLCSIIRLTQLAVPHLEKMKGNIVNVSSIGGLDSYPTEIAYDMSKAALDQFTKCISLELASKGIRVNSINPGDIETSILQTSGLIVTSEELEKYKNDSKIFYPVGRIGQVEDTSNAIEFLAKNASSFITGVLLPVDGGIMNVSLP